MNAFRLIISMTLLSSLLMFTACEKADPCLGQICQNDGFCVDGTCECDLYHTGENCELVRYPKSMVAKEVELDYLPNCYSWDGNTGPISDADVYIQVYEGDKLIYNTKHLFKINTSCGDCRFDRPITLKPDIQYLLRVYDYDELDDPDLILEEYFRPIDLMEDDYFNKWNLEVLRSHQSCVNGNYATGGWMKLTLINVHYNM